ncbi:hypothetical protein [Streptomyces sp. NPDC096030]|uniref:hypothetical protein n=1 Tax=Streptomyces sp. NPDC096030 TaxID=3155423 RepID=UPI00332B5EB4
MTAHQPPLFFDGWEAEADAKSGLRLTVDEKAFLDLHGLQPGPVEAPARRIETVTIHGGVL